MTPQQLLDQMRSRLGILPAPAAPPPEINGPWEAMQRVERMLKVKPGAVVDETLPPGEGEERSPTRDDRTKAAFLRLCDAMAWGTDGERRP